MKKRKNCSYQFKSQKETCLKWPENTLAVAYAYKGHSTEINI